MQNYKFNRRFMWACTSLFHRLEEYFRRW